ncbi:MAG: sugar O-acetyltransferase, partial [Selenomonadaceae bacterium]|nr:sugar O-acetyltransferase [Selenomonadaceae bacterium]
TEFELKDAGKIYDPADAEIMAVQTSCLKAMDAFNATDSTQGELRQKLLKEMLGAVGENCYIEPPFHANWGGKNIFFGNNVYANFNLTAVDDVEIIVGDNVLFAPNVTLTTANHPIAPKLRAKGYQYCKKIVIKNNVWICSGAIILAGVTIGENSVIAAGSVVTKNIPANVVAMGSPCKVYREISQDELNLERR